MLSGHLVWVLQNVPYSLIPVVEADVKDAMWADSQPEQRVVECVYPIEATDDFGYLPAELDAYALDALQSLFTVFSYDVERIVSKLVDYTVHDI